jgi:hypothetical protein
MASGHQPESLDAPDHARQRLGEGGFVQSDRIVYAVEVPSRDSYELGQRAVAGVTDRPPMVAVVGLATEAVIAVTAIEGRVDRDPVARMPIHDVRADIADHA